ncbi:MAG: homocysteine S-methyltransferase family protein [Pseudomonadales bacterium]
MTRCKSPYRRELPQLKERPFLTDGGLETTLCFQEGWELPEFAAFVLLDSASGRQSLQSYYRRYIAIALKHRAGLILESPTWRASLDWGERIGYNPTELNDINHRAIDLLAELRDQSANPSTPMVISGCIGPQGDGYAPESRMSADAAAEYHWVQARTFAASAADMLSALTMTYTDEAIGVVRAAEAVEMPIVISFTVETDGRLPTGPSLEDAIETVDQATLVPPAYYMINCAHPEHFTPQLNNGGQWLKRIGGLRSNASTKSHAELDDTTELDDGNPADFGLAHTRLQALLPRLGVYGGCCGTNERHIQAVAQHCLHGH